MDKYRIIRDYPPIKRETPKVSTGDAALRKLIAELDVKKEVKVYQAPTMDLLEDQVATTSQSSLDAVLLEDKLAEFGFQGTVEHISKGPRITRYEVRLAAGVRLSQVKNVAEDLAIALQSDRIRIQAPIPGTSLIGIEVANEVSSKVGIRQLIQAVRESDAELPIGIGVDVVGNPKVVDLAKMPHLLIAGQTGSGKSVGLNVILLSLLYSKRPENLKLVLIDPKRVEMTSYEDVPHLMCPVVTEPAEAVQVFEKLVREMENRYKILAEKKVRNIVSYNEIEGVEHMPYIVAVVDEMADLMLTAGKQVETYIVRLAQLARAVGIHLVLATQKPIVKVITGLIKSNMPSRISYQVTSKMDSRVILDGNGAEKLLGNGDLLMTYPGNCEAERFHGAWVSDKGIEKVCNFLKGE